MGGLVKPRSEDSPKMKYSTREHLESVGGLLS